MSLAPPPDGFPVVYDVREPCLRTCHLCVESFRTDDRGVPVLSHPELGSVVVCYRCAEALRRSLTSTDA